MLCKLKSNAVPKRHDFSVGWHESPDFEQKFLDSFLNEVDSVQVFGTGEVEELEDKFESGAENSLLQEEQTHQLEESKPREKGVLAKRRDHIDEPNNLRIELEFCAEQSRRYLDFVWGVWLQVSVLFLNRRKEEAFEQTHDELLLKGVIDLKSLEASCGCDDGAIDLSI